MSNYTTRIARPTYEPPSWLGPLLALMLAVLFGWAVTTHPTAAFLPAAAVVALPLLISARARVLFVVFGTLAVFGSEGLNAPKLLFLAGVFVAFGAALLRLGALKETTAFRILKPMLLSSLVLFAMLVFSLPVALAFEVPPTAWLRDIGPYVLFGCAPVFALEAATAFSPTTLRKVLVVAGAVGAVSFTLRWFANRSLADIGLAQVGLPTMLLAACLFAYGAAVILEGTRTRLGWAILTTVVFAMLISTGTRAAVVLLTAPLAILLGTRRRLARRFARLAVAAPLASVLAVVTLLTVVEVTDADRRELSRRASLLVDAVSAPERDESYLDRVSQARTSSRLWRSSPIVGVGPGHPFPWVNNRGVPQPPKTVVDSPISYVAKFGAIGVVALVFVVGGFVATLRRLRLSTRGRTVPQLALIGYGAIVASTAALVVPLEDKGMATGLLLLLALAVGDANDSAASRRARGVEAEA